MGHPIRKDGPKFQELKPRQSQNPYRPANFLLLVRTHNRPATSDDYLKRMRTNANPNSWWAKIQHKKNSVNPFTYLLFVVGYGKHFFNTKFQVVFFSKNKKKKKFQMLFRTNVLVTTFQGLEIYYTLKFVRPLIQVSRISFEGYCYSGFSDHKRRSWQEFARWTLVEFTLKIETEVLRVAICLLDQHEHSQFQRFYC